MCSPYVPCMSKPVPGSGSPRGLLTGCSRVGSILGVCGQAHNEPPNQNQKKAKGSADRSCAGVHVSTFSLRNVCVWLSSSPFSRSRQPLRLPTFFRLAPQQHFLPCPSPSVPGEAGTQHAHARHIENTDKHKIKDKAHTAPPPPASCYRPAVKMKKHAYRVLLPYLNVRPTLEYRMVFF